MLLVTLRTRLLHVHDAYVYCTLAQVYVQDLGVCDVCMCADVSMQAYYYPLQLYSEISYTSAFMDSLSYLTLLSNISSQFISIIMQDKGKSYT